MTYVIKNPSGILVEIDDKARYEERLQKKGFTPATPEELQAYELRRKIQANPDTAGITNIQYSAPLPNNDGYGQSHKHLQDALAPYNIHLDRNYTGQTIGLAYGYPEALQKLKTPVKVLFSMFESTKLPEAWQKDLELADLIIVPSKFCQKAFKDAGYESIVVPLGYDDSVFKYEPKEKIEPFTFLHYDAFNQRKGWDVVFKAFNEEFTKDEPVKLILKTTKLAGYPFPILKSQYPNIQVIKESYKHPEMAKLLVKSSCFVIPSRGEGFGHPPLEALATGTPVIMVDAHGFSEFYDPKYFFKVNLKGTTPALYDRYKGVDTGVMVEPDPDDLRHVMRFIYEHYAYALDMAVRGATWVKQNWTYKQTAEKLAPILKDAEKRAKKTGKVKEGTQLPTQSIIVLTHNALTYTKKCLESIKQNSTLPYELIVIDNASTDKTPEYLSKNKDIDVLILNTENTGVAAGRNLGIRKARGNIITFLDNDTEVKPGWQEKILANFTEDVGVVGKGGQLVPFLKPIQFADPIKTDGKAVVDVVPGYCFSFKRDLIGIVGEQYEGLPSKKFWHEDLDFCARVQLAGYKIVSDDDIPVIHYQHKSAGINVTDSDMVKKVEGYYENAAYIQERLISSNILYIYRNYRGDDAPDSYDRVAYGLQNALRKQGVVVIRRPDITTPPFSFNLCKMFDIINNGQRYVVLHQENDRCPSDWQDALKHVDHILAVSEHLVEVTKDEPYADKIINYSPDGIDPDVYNTSVEPLNDFYPDKFKFLMVGATQPRKNTQNLLKWYSEVYTDKDDVVLIIKDMGYGHKSETERYIAELKKNNPHLPEIAYIYDNWTSDYLARVYRTVALNGAYIHPHHAECFGMPHIEAAACGCRIGTTNWGGPKYNLKDFDTVTLFNYEYKPSPFHNWTGEPYYKADEKPQWADPSEIDVKKFLVDAPKEKYDKKKAEQVSKIVLDKFSYETKAKQLKEILYANARRG